MSITISIITATYNSEATIGACLASVASQNYPHIEHIIIDGESKDGTLSVLQAHAKTHKTIKWYSEPDKGIYDALNKGLQKATGDIIGFLHSDDVFFDAHVLSKIASAFKANKDINGVYGNLHYVKFEDVNHVIRHWKSRPFKNHLLQQGWMPAHPTLFLKNEVYHQYGNFDLNFSIAADYDFVLRIFKQHHLRFYFINSVITKMRVGGASNKSLKNIVLKSKEDVIALRKNRFRCPLSILFLKNVSKISQWLLK